MARELVIVFLYDTEVSLREEEDPQTAIVFFHPSWVSGNQRMALCGQLIGVAQFLVTTFAFPGIISLTSGKFAMKQIGRFILCVGTDRNIPDWILTKRCKILYHTLEFFHANLNLFGKSWKQSNIAERLANAMEVYLPVLLYAGNIFGNCPTIRLPKSASSIYLEAAQMLECLQDNEAVYGGAIFYQNKVVMSQLSTEVTKQIVMTDPCKIKIPAENVSTSFHLPVGVQLLIVYISEAELQSLREQKLPSIGNRKNCKFEKGNNVGDSNSDSADLTNKEKSRIFTVVEEDYESEHVATKTTTTTCLSQMPDLVIDAVKTSNSNNNSSEGDDKKLFSEIKVESYIVDSFACRSSLSCSSENLCVSPAEPSVTYFSFNFSQNGKREDESPEDTAKKTTVPPSTGRRVHLKYYNTISDPLNPWFRSNGLPASKMLHDDRITFYCHDMNFDKTTSSGQKMRIKETKECLLLDVKKTSSTPMTETNVFKPTNRLKKPTHFNLQLKTDLTGKENQVTRLEYDVPVTPLMSKLSLQQLSENDNFVDLLTPSTSFKCIGDETFSTKNEKGRKSKQSSTSHKSCLKELYLESSKKCMKETILFVFGHQNVSLYLLMDAECGKNGDLIHSLWKSCLNGIKNLERHFQQCFESIPSTQTMNMDNDLYSYLNIHSTWETLHHNGSWSGPQLDVINAIQNDFNNESTLTDVTVRFEDSVIYGNQMADNRVFYQQNVGNIAGLPMPSDLMGVISLKAKRRLERDFGILII